MISRRRFLQVSAATGCLGLGAGFYTWRVEPHWLEFVDRSLPIADLPDGLCGSRLVQLSDLHIGPRVNDRYLERSFGKVADLAPEFVVYTGDFITHAPGFADHARRMFRHLPLGKLGTFGILGNHDYGPGWSSPTVARQIASLATDAGVRVLRNELVETGGLHVVGMDDLWAGRFDPQNALAGVTSGAATVVLSHNPDTVDLGGWDAYSGWILAGHTHGGQCKPPFLPPPLLPVRNRRYTAGEFSVSRGRRLYVNRGIGHLLTVRFNVRPEVTVFWLERL